VFNSFSTTIQAAIWMTGTIVSFSAMAVSGREISFELDTFEIMMYRSIIGLIIVLLLAKLFKTHREIIAFYGSKFMVLCSYSDPICTTFCI
jgi:hypothetical protein